MLIQKDKTKGNIASNYWLITCLPLVWKLLTGILADEIYDYLEKKMLLPEEQKWYRRNCKGRSDLLFIDKMILRKERMRKKNLPIAWIHYKKSYNMVPHSWIVEYLGMVGVSQQIKHFLSESMKAWRVDLTCNNQSLGREYIKRGTFQGDSLLPLLFVLSLTSVICALAYAIYYEFVHIKSSYRFSSNK